jgi:hypothetical protein
MRKMQIKTTIRYHFIPSKMSVIKNTKNNKYWREFGENGTFGHCWWDIKRYNHCGK